MRHFTTAELSRLQSTQVSAMQDTCILQTYTAASASSAYGYGYGGGYSDTVPVACGLDMSPSREVMEGAQIALPDARLRLPLGTSIINVDRVRVTHRYGVALSTPLVYDVIGLPERGPSGLQLNLRLATEGAASTPIPVETYSFDLSDGDNSFYLALL